MLIIDSKEQGEEICIHYPVIKTKPLLTFLYIGFQSFFYESMCGYVCVYVCDTCIKNIYMVLDSDFYNIKNISKNFPISLNILV